MRQPQSFTGRTICRALPVCALTLSLAQGAETNRPPSSLADLDNLSLEQLAGVQVISVAKKETTLFTSPAAIAVVTSDDIRLFGVTSIPEALRQVPGMDVAQINPAQWSISSRGFNTQYADKLLVLVDGRTVFTPGFSGVPWEIQDLVMEDLDRIEVVRGPGATLWGDNAVNGVINIISKSARDTQGALASTSFGTDNQSITSLRYGGKLDDKLFYRIYGKFESEDGFLDSTGHRLPDGWDSWQAGARLDWEPNLNDHFTLQGDYLDAFIGEPAQMPILTPPFAANVNVVAHAGDANVLGRWTHDFSATSQLALQAYYDHVIEPDANLADVLDVGDIDLQHHFLLGERQDIVWGAGFRESVNQNYPDFNFSLVPPKSYLQTYNVFAQDDVTLVPERLHLILGSKFDYNTFSKFDVQPSGRLLWTPAENQTVWAAVSRAVTTPSLVEESSRFNQSAFPTPGGPGLVSLYGNPDFHSEQLLAYEAGYRVEPSLAWSFDFAAYYNIYKGVQAFQPGTPFPEATPIPHLVFPQTTQNLLSGDTYGVELTAQWKPADIWRVSASYSWLHMRLQPQATTEGDSPQNQFQIRSYLNLLRDLEFTTALYYVDRLPNQNVDSYFGLDLGLNWRINRHWEAGLFAQNLLQDGHVEFGSFRTPARTEIPRSAFAKITCRF